MQDLAPGYSIHPNPSTGVFTISSVNTINAVSVYTTLGERVYFNMLDDQKEMQDIDISRFGSGMYFVVTESGGKLITQKVVVQ